MIFTKFYTQYPWLPPSFICVPHSHLLGRTSWGWGMVCFKDRIRLIRRVSCEYISVSYIKDGLFSGFIKLRVKTATSKRLHQSVRHGMAPIVPSFQVIQMYTDSENQCCFEEQHFPYWNMHADHLGACVKAGSDWSWAEVWDIAFLANSQWSP